MNRKYLGPWGRTSYNRLTFHFLAFIAACCTEAKQFKDVTGLSQGAFTLSQREPTSTNVEKTLSPLPIVVHGRIPRKSIDQRALEIVERLQKSHFETYLVGGCVRDILAGVEPKDFDIVTNAQPQQIKKCVPYCFIIGRRFKLVLAKRGEQQFEVATFRRQMNAEEYLDAKNAVEVGTDVVMSDNLFGTSEEDAKRRDFTINGLFYDPRKGEIKDYVGGLADIDTRTIRMIGDPKQRLLEDPIRILRALRLSHKLGFGIHESLRREILECASSLKDAILPRKREEYIKLLKLKDPYASFLEMYDLQLLDSTLPSLRNIFEDPEREHNFMLGLRSAPMVGFENSAPLEIMCSFLYIFFRSMYHEIPISELPAVVQRDANLSILKDEFGVFKSEAQHFISCLESFAAFENWEKFDKKGERRKASFIMQDHIALAYRLFLIDHALSSRANLYWRTELRQRALLSEN